MHNNSCKFQIACQLEERSKHSEYTKNVSQNYKRQHNNKPVADVNNVSAANYLQDIEVGYYEEVTASENNPTFEDEFNFNRTNDVSFFLYSKAFH